MDDLVKCLYEFAQAHRMGSLYEDEEYKEYTHTINSWEKRVREYLTAEQRKDLDWLVGALTSQGDIESEHLFRATLTLSRELSALVR